MAKYCRNCGKQIDDSKFCPECGTSVDGEMNTSNNTKDRIMETYQLLLGLFPIVYIVLFFCDWFKFGMFGYSTETYNCMNLLFKLNKLSIDSFLLGLFAFIFFIMAIISVILCVKAIVSAITKATDIFDCISGASVFSIVAGSFGVAAVLFLKIILNNEGLEWASEMFGFTISPILLIISAVIGKTCSNKLAYTNWKSEHSDIHIKEEKQGMQNKAYKSCAVSKKKVCVKCGTQNTWSNVKCSKCGYFLD